MEDGGRATGGDLVAWAGGERTQRTPVLEGRTHALENHYRELWFTLARSRWNSLAVVPADADDSAAGVAAKLADVGRRLRTTPVTFLVMAGAMEFAAAGKFVSVMGRKDGVTGDAASTPQIVVAVPSVVAEPLALAVTEAVDAVVLYVRKGRTRRSSLSRTVELIGRDRIVGCVMG